MKFFHIADLHIGKYLKERSLIEDQRHILGEVLSMVALYHPDAVVIAGDVYDKSVPPAEAVTVFDWFLTELNEMDVRVLLISGNHDSAERLAFGSGIFRKNHIYFAGTLKAAEDGSTQLARVTLEDSFGEVDFWLLPFIRPSREDIPALLLRQKIDYSRRNVLVSHQFYTAEGVSLSTCDSETVNVGGLDNVDSSALIGFDYVALGHLHRQQRVKEEFIRYSGTLLKYSISEQKDRKVLLMVELGEKGAPIHIEEIALHPLRDVREIKGKLEDIIAANTPRTGEALCDDYISVVLTDEMESFRPKDRLSDIFPNLLSITVSNSFTTMELGAFSDSLPEWETPDTLQNFRDFFRLQSGRELSVAEERLIEKVIKDETD